MDRWFTLGTLFVTLTISIATLAASAFVPEFRTELCFTSALMMSAALLTASFLQKGNPASIASLNTDRIYRLISVTKTGNGKWLYLLEDATNHVFCVMDKDSFTGDSPCYVRVADDPKSGYVITACSHTETKQG